MAWDETKPTDAQDWNNAAGDIRDNNSALENAIGQDHDFTTGSTQTGKHNRVTLIEQSGDETGVASAGTLWNKSGVLYFRDETGTVQEVFSATQLLDEDDMASDSATKPASQQSIKAYVDTYALLAANLLDEDTMASDSETQPASQQSIKAYVDNNVGYLLGRARTINATYQTSASLIPKDDTIPQITEGSEVMSLTYNRQDATSSLQIHVTCMVAHSVALGEEVVAALFTDGGSTDAIAVGSAYMRTNDVIQTLKFSTSMPTSATGNITFMVRLGPVSGNAYLNGIAAGRQYGGMLKSSIFVEEHRA